MLGTADACRRLLPQAEVIFEYRSSEAAVPAQHREAIRRGFLGTLNEVWELVNRRNDRQSYQDGLFRFEVLTFDEGSVREALLNALSHRDYHNPGSVFIRQYPRRLEIVSPGGFPPGITRENVLDRQLPRNRAIAEALEHCGLVERSGQGMNRIFEASIKQGKPLPDLDGTDAHQVRVSLRGELQHSAFVRFLEKLGRDRLDTFTTHDLLVLDLAYRGEKLPERLRSRVNHLVEVGALERFGRKIILSRGLYAALGKHATYTRRKGLDHDAQKSLLMQHILVNSAEGAPLGDLVQVLPNVPELTVKRLLQELKREGRIRPTGQRRWARWVPVLPTEVSLDS